VPDIHETAYPCLKSSFSDRELYEFYTPSAADLALALEVTKGVGPKICFLILLKTFQRLGYFVLLQQTLFVILTEIELRSTLPEDSLCQALSFLLTRRKSRQEWISIPLLDDNNQASHQSRQTGRTRSRRRAIDREIAEHAAHAADALHFKSAEFAIIARG